MVNRRRPVWARHHVCGSRSRQRFGGYCKESEDFKVDIRRKKIIKKRAPLAISPQIVPDFSHLIYTIVAFFFFMFGSTTFILLCYISNFTKVLVLILRMNYKFRHSWGIVVIGIIELCLIYY